MTIGKGKRSYRACLRCRQRKTKCDLDGVGEPRKPPCVSCHHSGSDCVLAGSLRGGNFRPYRPGKRAALGPRAARSTRDSRRGHVEPLGREPSVSNNFSNDTGGDPTDDALCAELRNPSDALHILAQSDELEQRVSQARSHSGTAVCGNSTDFSPQSNTEIWDTYQEPFSSEERAATILHDFELIKKGLLRPSVLPELLLSFSKMYHPYCPIAPAYFLGQSALEKIQPSDYFLLTAILTVASKDSPRHSLTHRHCWEHTQRLLLDVLLARPWTLTSRTVEGLLLLSEWLPHIQMEQATPEEPNSLFSEDRTAWSLIGLAVRHGYLLHLDRAAFRNSRPDEPKEQTERKRLIWTFIYLADRQISVRLGQSFWARGPSLSAHFTAKDFSSLQSPAGNGDEDYASVLQATIELTQILHNAHTILYSSQERTLEMVKNGDYNRYLDDFQNAAIAWNLTWSEISATTKIKNTLLLMYEYLCLYVNAFSFQAVLTRASALWRSSDKERQKKRPMAKPFSRGIMSSPDGRYVFDAITAAINTLRILNGLDPKAELCYLPSRYYLYGVYAAVFLHKADCAETFQSDAQLQEATCLAFKFADVMEEAASTKSHISSRCSRMLRKLWCRREQRAPSSSLVQCKAANKPYVGCERRKSDVLLTCSGNLALPGAGQGSLDECLDTEGISAILDTPRPDQDTPALLQMEDCLFVPFMPNLADFDLGSLEDILGEQFPIPDRIPQ